jgi:hypothetical protein
VYLPLDRFDRLFDDLRCGGNLLQSHQILCVSLGHLDELCLLGGAFRE